MGASSCDLHKTTSHNLTKVPTMQCQWESSENFGTFQSPNLTFPPPLCDKMYMCMSAVRDLFRNHDKTMRWS